MKVSTVLKWISGGLEAFWGIPVLGGVLIISLAWLPLLFMLMLHIVTLIFSTQEKENIHGSIVGVITSCLGWIPFVGMTMHIISAILLMIDAFQSGKYD
ncbi:MAG TPA: hypothetical protein VF095_11105 [Bacillota bacterium]